MTTTKRLCVLLLLVALPRAAGCDSPADPATPAATGPATGFSGPLSPQGGTVVNTAALTGALALGTGAATVGAYAGSGCGSGFVTAVGAGGGVTCGSASGVLNEAGDQAIVKSDGTNLFASALNDDGATVTSSEPLEVSGAITADSGLRVFDAVGTGLARDGTNANQVDLSMSGASCGTQAMSGLSTTGNGTCSTALVSASSPTSGNDARFSTTTAITNSSSTDDGTTKTLGGVALTPCASTVTGVQTLTIPAGCSVFEVAPASELDIVAIVAPAGARDVWVRNRGTAEVYFFAAYTSGTTAANRFEGTFGGANGGWPLDPGTWIDAGYSLADSRWSLPVALSAGSTTFFGNAATSGGYVSSSAGVYAGGFTDWYLSSVLDTTGCAYGVNATATCYTNALGYQEGVTQLRNLEISNGTGHGTTHQLAFFDAVDTAVDLVNNAFTFTAALATLTTDVSLGRHLRSSDAAITLTNVSSCGASPVVQSGSTDLSGAITFGAGTATSCQIAFNHPYLTTAPFCTCSSMGAATSGVFQSCTASTTALSVSAAASTGAFKGSWICTGGT